MIVRKMDLSARGWERLPHPLYFVSRKLLPIICAITPPESCSSDWIKQLPSCKKPGSESTFMFDIEYYIYHGFRTSDYVVTQFDSSEEYNQMIRRILNSPYHRTPHGAMVELMYKMGDSESLRQLFREGRIEKSAQESNVRLAITKGHLACVELFFEYKCTNARSWDDLRSTAINANRLDVLMFLLQKMGTTTHLMNWIARGPDTDVIIKAVRDCYDIPLTNEVFTAAASKGNMIVLKYMVDPNNHKEGDEHPLVTYKAAVSAATAGKSETLQFLLENGCTPSMGILEAAVKSGSKQCFDTAFSLGCNQPNLDCLQEAVRRGDIYMLEKMLPIPIPSIFTDNEQLCNTAASNGQLGTLRYLHESGFKWSTFTCSEAAANDYLSCLEYAHENGCPWDETTCRGAVHASSDDCLKYAMRNNCPINRWECLTEAMEIPNNRKCFRLLVKDTKQLERDAFKDDEDRYSDSDNDSDSD